MAGLPADAAGLAPPLDELGQGEVWPPPEWTLPPVDAPPESLAGPLDAQAPLPWPPPEWAEPLPSEVPQPEPTGRERVEAVDAGQPLPRAPEPATPGDVEAALGMSVFPEPPAEPEPEPFALEHPDLLAPPDLEEAYQGQQMARFEQMSPEGKAAAIADFTLRRDKALADKYAEEQRKDEAEQAKNQLVQDNAYAQLLVDRHFLKEEKERLAKQEVDPDRWFSSLSTGQQVSFFLSAAISGFLNPGGDNPMARMAAQSIDRDIDLQRADLNRKLGNLDERMDMAAGDYEAAHQRFLQLEARRQAAYAKVDERLAVEQAKYDPRGTRFLALAGERAAARAHAVQAEAAADKEALERRIKIGDFNARQQKAVDEHAAHQKRMAGGTGGPRYTAAQVQQLYPGLQVPDKPGGWSPKEIGALVGVRKDVASLDPKADPKTVAMQQQVEQFERGSIVTGSDGQPIGRARYGPDDAVKLAKFTADYEAFRKTSQRLIDLLANGEKEYGGWGSGRWPSERKTAVEKLQNDLAVRLAKIRDPESVAREGEVKIAAADLPQLDTLTTGRNPKVAYKTIMKTADDAYDAQVGTRIEYLDPSKSPTGRYQAGDEQLLSPEPTRAARVREAVRDLGVEPPSYEIYGEGTDEPVQPPSPPKDDDPWEKARRGE